MDTQAHTRTHAHTHTHTPTPTHTHAHAHYIYTYIMKIALLRSQSIDGLSGHDGFNMGPAHALRETFTPTTLLFGVEGFPSKEGLYHSTLGERGSSASDGRRHQCDDIVRMTDGSTSSSCAADGTDRMSKQACEPPQVGGPLSGQQCVTGHLNMNGMSDELGCRLVRGVERSVFCESVVSHKLSWPIFVLQPNRLQRHYYI
ncbi:hypothetical protein EVAR_25971_1 [Eumeta japonica]|uniref:Uncharacterized protein n=1 Tax=Eumeta variegata TaxID=151549 RepID=A0A4C1V1G0_EUMVA|nr:hypothetical protein EVAR_25971_1 [Eumeta japonica]